MGSHLALPKEFPITHNALSLFAYHSILADEYDASCVGAIIKTARAFNASHGITGVLLFDGERFCQYIEGETAALDALVECLRKDPRHQNITTLLHEPLHGNRRYPDWSMAYSDVEDSIIDQMLTRAPNEALALLQEKHLTLDIG